MFRLGLLEALGHLLQPRRAERAHRPREVAVDARVVEVERGLLVLAQHPREDRVLVEVVVRAAWLGLGLGLRLGLGEVLTLALIVTLTPTLALTLTLTLALTGERVELHQVVEVADVAPLPRLEEAGPPG